MSGASEMEGGKEYLSLGRSGRLSSLAVHRTYLFATFGFSESVALPSLSPARRAENSVV